MKIKDLIEHLKTLDQDKELVIIATDPTDWDYGFMIKPELIHLEKVFPYDDNGLKGEFEDNTLDETGCDNEVECYVIGINI